MGAIQAFVNAGATLVSGPPRLEASLGNYPIRLTIQQTPPKGKSSVSGSYLNETNVDRSRYLDVGPTWRTYAVTEVSADLPDGRNRVTF